MTRAPVPVGGEARLEYPDEAPWFRVTGFDVHTLGDKESREVMSSIRSAIEVKGGHRGADPVWVDFDETIREWNETSGDVVGRPAYEMPRHCGAVQFERMFCVGRMEEPRDG